MDDRGRDAVGGLLDAVEDGVTGLVVPPRDPRALREALERLLADDAFGGASAPRRDDELRALLARGGGRCGAPPLLRAGGEK